MNISPEREAELKEHHPRIILKHLLNGGEWEFEGRTFVLGENNDILMVAYELNKENGITHINYKEGEKRYLSTEMRFKDFLNNAFNTPIEVTAIMAADAALQDINRSKR